MENASKALLIAGAILLAILIISLGLMAYNGAKNTVGSSNLNKQEIEAFNSQWENYIGSNKTAAEVRALCSAAIANNASEKKLGTNKFITISGGDGTNTISISETWAASGTNTTAPMLVNSKTYKVEVDSSAGYSDGLIVKINVSVQS